MNRQSFTADRRLIDALKERSHPVSCREGRILFSQGDSPVGLHIVESGEAALTMTSESGRVVMCLHAGAGSILGLPAIIGNVPYSLTAMAGKGSEVRFVTRDRFEDVIRVEPSLYPFVLQILASEVRSARLAISKWVGGLAVSSS
jgi:CRP/FNR family transcriptional regulator